MIKYFLEKISAQENLALDEAFRLMQLIMDGIINNSHLAGLLLALRTKGETPEEVAGFVKAMRERSIKIASPSEQTIDLCGTGGDCSGTFNISTAASFAAAGAGIPVAKHGNRSISSKSGSADVLKELGINISLSPSRSEKALHEIGIAFLFAPEYHPSMKNAAPVRSELGMKTIFNLLGPLTNPAGTKRQLIGTYSKNAADLLCEAAKYLDMERVCFINTEDKFDEIALNGDTSIAEYSKGNWTRHYSVCNETFGYQKVNIDEITGDTPKQNAEIILSVLRDKQMNAPFRVIAANTAAALYCGGMSDNLEECKLLAEESILSGKAYDKLLRLKSYSGAA
jgi:anthranilate phosphoribosyltransferase